MTIGAEWLQYGSFGLLAAVLIAIGMYLKKRDEKAQEVTAAKDKRALDIVEAKDKQSLEFMQALIQQSAARQEIHEQAWQKMTENAIATQQKLSSVMTQLSLQLEAQTKCLEDHSKTVTKNQEVILSAIMMLRKEQ
jgi:hypothetical protein